MRVLHVVHDLPPDSHGGTQEYVLGLARLQRDAGDEVGVIAGAAAHVDADTAGETTERSEDGLRVWRLRHDHTREPLPGETGCPRLEAEVERVARAFGPDVAHVHHWIGLGTDLGPRIKAATGAATVVTLHDLYATCPRSFRMPDHRHLCASDATLAECAACVAPDAGVPADDSAGLGTLEARLAARRERFARELSAADLVVLLSAAQRELLASVPGFPRLEHVAVLPIGISGAPAVRKACGFAGSGRLRVASWAGYDPRKGLHDLVRAVGESPRRDALALTLYGRPGEPAYMDELRALARGGDVTFHGEFDDADRAEFGARHDVAVFPYLAFETHALAVDEALYAGLAVITSDRGAPPARLGARGATYPAGDAAALGRLLAELAGDRARVDRMRAAPHGAIGLAAHARSLAAHYAELRSPVR